MNRTQYQAYQAAVAQFLTREGIHPGCYSTTDHSYFSWSNCECCKRTSGGSRVTLAATSNTSQVFTYEICLDCVYYLEYGRLDDVAMIKVTESEAE